MLRYPDIDRFYSPSIIFIGAFRTRIARNHNPDKTDFFILYHRKRNSEEKHFYL